MTFKKSVATILSSAAILTAVSPCAFAGKNNIKKSTCPMSTTCKIDLGDVKVKTLIGKPIYKKYMELKDAVVANDYGKVKNLLDTNKELDVNARFDEYDHTLLHCAATFGYLEMCKLLIENGANVTAENTLGRTPLFSANYDISKLLMKNGYYPVKAVFLPKYMKLRDAVINGEYEKVKSLLNTNKFDVNAVYFSGNTLLHTAAIYGHLGICKLLIEKDANVNAKNDFGETPLFVAYSYYICELLIENGANVNATDNSGKTPLHEAAVDNKPGICELLIDRGANVNATDNSGKTPLQLAIKNGNLQQTKGNTDVNIKDWFDRMVLRKFAAESDILRINELLTNGGAYVSAETLYVQKGAIDVLIEKGANVNVKDDLGRTLLYEAAINNQPEIFKLLISKGTDVNAKDRSGRTLLHGAATYNDLKICKLLIENEAYVNAKNDSGKTPLDYAKSDEIKQLLTSHGAKHGNELK